MYLGMLAKDTKQDTSRICADSEYVLAKGFGGLGNRLITLLNAIAIALSTQRILVVDWSDDTYSDSGENVFSCLFQLKHVRETTMQECDFSAVDIWPPAWAANVYATSRELMLTYATNQVNGYQQFERDVACDLGKINNNARVIVVTHELADPVLTFAQMGVLPKSALLRPSDAFRIIFSRHLRFQPLVERRSDQVLARCICNRVIGVHVRASDNPYCAGWNVQDYFARIDALNALQSYVFLATDNIEVLGHFQRQYGDLLLWQGQWLPPNPGDRAHANDACPNRLEHAISSLADLLCLSRVDVFIGAVESSFSRVASMLRKPTQVTLQIGGGRMPIVRYRSLQLLMILLPAALRRLRIAMLTRAHSRHGVL
jgi:hypothetical protein